MKLNKIKYGAQNDKIHYNFHSHFLRWRVVDITKW